MGESQNQLKNLLKKNSEAPLTLIHIHVPLPYIMETSHHLKKCVQNLC